MGDSDYAPFNEAMCVNPATTQVFDEDFIKTRAEGHNSSVESYTKGNRSIKKLLRKSTNVLFYGLVKICFAK